MTLTPFRPRRTLSRYVDDKSVRDFERVAKENGLLPKHDRLDELMAIENPDGATIEEIAQLLGQSE